MNSRRWIRPLMAGSITAALTAAGLAGLPLGAQADTAPAAGVPATVSGKALPTWQINGVGWQQAVVGNTVYVVGSFSAARPPGVAAGGAGERPAQNIFAYDIRTGNPVANFNHNLNGQALAIAVSPDGSRIYVGGDFTTVDGVAAGHLAAFDTATGALVTSFKPTVAGQVRALAVSGDTVYVGGAFWQANGQQRNQLAAFTTADGTLTSWAPTPDAYGVRAMVMTPDLSKVVVGGQFRTMNGAVVNGQAALDPVTAENKTWKISQSVVNYNQGGVTALSSDGTNIYGTSFAFGTGGNFEGPFSVNPDDGSVRWVADCLGDTYDIAALDGAAYSAGHAHDCRMIGGFPDTNPRVRWNRALAFSTEADGYNSGPDVYGWDYSSLPKPKLLHWFPEFDAGSYTGIYQGPWSIRPSTNGYLAVAGEFNNVNGVKQQGLTRFAKTSVDPSTQPPTFDSLPHRTVTAPVAATGTAGIVKVTHQAAWDVDNANLTYELFRDYGTPSQTVVATKQLGTTFWDQPDQSVADAAPTGTHTYRVRVSDPSGGVLLSAESNPVNVTAGASPYAAQVIKDGASSYWRLDATSGTTVVDQLGAANGTGVNLTLGQPGAITGDPNPATSFNGSSSTIGAGPSAVPGPQTFSVSAWFKTNTTRGGKIVGFGNSRTGTSTSNDRNLYMENGGKLRFGIYDGTARTVVTPKAYNDNAWHQAVATVDATGMSLYVDGQLAARDVAGTTPQAFNGYWRIGGDTISSWPGAPTSRFFAGTIDDVAVYPKALDAAAVAGQYTASGRTLPNLAATDTYGQSVQASKPDLFWRLDESAGPLAQDASGNSQNGVYSAAGLTYGVAGPSAGSKAVRLNGTSGALASAGNFSPTPDYSLETWFRSTSTTGGLLIGSGSAATGLSSTTDRSVSLTGTGKLRFSTGGAADVAVQSAGSFNDGAWHHVVATRAGSTLNLYVDGQPVASGAAGQNTTAPFFWRVGYDKVVSGSTSNFLAADVEDAAVYSRALPLSEAKAHFQAGGGTTANVPPTASITATNAGLSVAFTGAASDPDGTVTGHLWNFGDGTATSTAADPTHVYAAPGTYTVTLKVTDNANASTTVTKSITVTNTAPVAAFTTSSLPTGVAVDAGTSTDPDGTIVSYTWNFGDGSAPATGVTASHTYAATGTYTVTLTVKDNAGGTGTATKSVAVVADAAPTAAFTTTTDDLKLTVDASTSSDPDGTITTYGWTFGDNTPAATGVNATHTYATNGTYPVTLTVTDDKGAKTVLTKQVVIAGPVAKDAFARTLTGSWGSADVGGQWSTDSANVAVAGGRASMTPAPGTGINARLNGVSSTDTDLSVDLAVDKLPAGGWHYISVVARGTEVNGYQSKVGISSTGQMALFLARDINGAETVLDWNFVPGTYVPGTTYTVRMQAVGNGTTALRAKMWPASATEPAAWTASGSDTTASLQQPAGVQLRVYLSGRATNTPIRFTFANLLARPSA